MKTKVIISILLLLVLATTMVVAKDGNITKDVYNQFKKVAPEENIPIQTTNTITAVEQATYTDIWTSSSTYDTLVGSYMPETTLMTQYIDLKYNSTVTVQFSSEVATVSEDGQATINVYIDGILIKPGTIIFDTERGYLNYEPRSFTWSKDFVKKGKHTIKVKASAHGFGQSPGEQWAESNFWHKSLVTTANGYGH